MADNDQAEDVLRFWFASDAQARWFNSTKAFDDLIADRYLALWREAALGRLNGWETTAEGAVALVIVLDQFPLNMFRNHPASFSTEAGARDVADRAIARGLDAHMEDQHKSFLYLPYMHSESLSDQERSVALFESFGAEDNAHWALHHREIVQRFGRFPHRNAILGRTSTPEEIAWLNSGSAFSG
jgi:uncharacterized protein (DUF924 family)